MFALPAALQGRCLMVDMVGSRPGPDGLRLLYEGEQVAFRIAVERDAFVGVWTSNAGGSVVQLFPTPADTDHFVRAGQPRIVPGPNSHITATLGQGPEQVRIVAALRPRKGHRDALAAWPGVLARHPDAVLLLVGSGPEEARLRAQVHDLQLDDRVVFAGLRRDVPRILQASTLVALPTRTEALPTVLLEAAASARACPAPSSPLPMPPLRWKLRSSAASARLVRFPSSSPSCSPNPCPDPS